MKKVNKFLLVLMASVFLISCSKDADEAANSSGFMATDINGKWTHSASGSSYSISAKEGTGKVAAVGTAFPAGALNGTALTKVTLVRGGYWEAESHTYYPSTGWTTSSKTIGLAMATDKKTFKIGTAVYTRQ